MMIDKMVHIIPKNNMLGRVTAKSKRTGQWYVVGIPKSAFAGAWFCADEIIEAGRYFRYVDKLDGSQPTYETCDSPFGDGQ